MRSSTVSPMRERTKPCAKTPHYKYARNSASMKMSECIKQTLHGGTRIGTVGNCTSDDDIVGTGGQRLSRGCDPLLIIYGLIGKADPRRHDFEFWLHDFADELNFPRRAHNTVDAAILSQASKPLHLFIERHFPSHFEQSLRIEAGQNGHGDDHRLFVAEFLPKVIGHGLHHRPAA